MNSHASSNRCGTKVFPGCESPTESSSVLTNDDTFFYQSSQFGIQNFLARAFRDIVYVYEMGSTQLVQQLSGHNAPVTCVCWRQPPTSCLQHGLVLFSGDANGVIVSWDVTEGMMLSSIQAPCAQPISVLSFLSDHHLLVVTQQASSYIFSAHLTAAETLPPHSLPLSRGAAGTRGAGVGPGGSVEASKTVSREGSASAARKSDVGAGPANTIAMNFSNFNNTIMNFMNNSTNFVSGTFSLGNGAGEKPTDAPKRSTTAPGPTATDGAPPPPLTASQQTENPHLCVSKLHTGSAMAVVLGDRVRVISPVDVTGVSPSKARDLIYDSESGEISVIDAFFSQSHEEILFFCTRNFVGMYDWKLNTVLNEQIVWLAQPDVEFRRLFPSSPQICSADEQQLPNVPLFYTLGTDQRLTAWYVLAVTAPGSDSAASLARQRSPSTADVGGRFKGVSVDIRGARIPSKAVVDVSQSEVDSTVFAVIFADCSIAKWHYDVRLCRWSLQRHCAAPLVQTREACRVGDSPLVCCALERGHVALVDVMHNVAVRRFSLVYSGGTTVAQLAPHHSAHLLWVVTHRALGGRHHHQVSLLDTRSGEIARVLRKPLTGERTPLKELAEDPTGRFLLLLFWDGTFEVWGVDSAVLIHMHSGLGVAHAAWAPDPLRACASNVQGDPQMLAVVFSEGTVSLWSVHADCIVVSRDAVNVLSSSAVEGGYVRSAMLPTALVLVDSCNGAVSVQQGTRGKLSLVRLKDMPSNVHGRVTIAAASWTAAAAAAPSQVAMRSSSQRDVAAPSAAQEEVGTSVSGNASGFVAIAFADGVFGVWDAESGDRIGYSYTKPSIRGIRCQRLLWVRRSLVVLSKDGSLYVLNERLLTANSSVSSRALRRPIESAAFLLPTHRTYLQTACELALLGGATPDSAGGDRATEDSAAASAASPSIPAAASSGALPSIFIRGIPSECFPLRGPFGQLFVQPPHSLHDELQLYLSTMLPLALRRRISRHQTGAAVVPAPTADSFALAYAVACWMGQPEKQRLWGLALVKSSGMSAGASCTDDLSVSSAQAPLTALTTGIFPHVDLLSSCLWPPAFVRRNRLSMCRLREAALRSGAEHNVNDAEHRQLVARELLKLGDRAAAAAVLLECQNESPRFNQLATLGVAIAAASAAASLHQHATSQAPGGGGGGDSFAEFRRVGAHAAALLLAAGQVEAALEKYLLCGDTAETCAALQSQGRWHEAAMLCAVSPDNRVSSGGCSGDAEDGDDPTPEVYRRWAEHLTRNSCHLQAARLMLYLGDNAAALRALTRSAHYTDASGLLALMMAHDLLQSGVANVDSTAAGDDKEKARTNDVEEVRSLVTKSLEDYESLLSTVGNVAGAALVRDVLHSLRPSRA